MRNFVSNPIDMLKSRDILPNPADIYKTKYWFDNVKVLPTVQLALSIVSSPQLYLFYFTGPCVPVFILGCSVYIIWCSRH